MGALSIKKSWRRAELKIRGLKDVLHLNSDIPNSLPLVSSGTLAALPTPLGILDNPYERKLAILETK